MASFGSGSAPTRNTITFSFRLGPESALYCLSKNPTPTIENQVLQVPLRSRSGIWINYLSRSLQFTRRGEISRRVPRLRDEGGSTLSHQLVVTNHCFRPGIFCHSQGRMRLLAEILIIAALIFFCWNTPFKQYADRASRTITSTLDGMGGSLQKNQDKSVKRY